MTVEVNLTLSQLKLIEGCLNVGLEGSECTEEDYAALDDLSGQIGLMVEKFSQAPGVSIIRFAWDDLGEYHEDADHQAVASARAALEAEVDALTKPSI